MLHLSTLILRRASQVIQFEAPQASYRAFVHPRVTGVCGADVQEVNNLEEAQAIMKLEGVKENEEVLRSTVKDLHRRARRNYYAVALDKSTGIL